MLQIQLVALAEEHVGTVCADCRNWRELAAFGPSYWRPRSVAELRRKAAAISGPRVASEYTFVIAAADSGLLEGERLVGGVRSTGLIGATVSLRWASAYGIPRIVVAAMVEPPSGKLWSERSASSACSGSKPGSSKVMLRLSPCLLV